jgi:hypothetical protein
VKRLAMACVVAGLAGCSQQTQTSVATLLGTYDLVFVDDRPDDTLASRAGGVGIPNRYLFVTSSDTNDLRVLRLWREGFLRPQALRGPNPLEALSIPVLERPTLLATDEGQLASTGERVTGSYVFATHPGATEISIVGARPSAPGNLRQVSGRPMATPAPVTAFAATMGAGLTALPATSTLFFATWDGTVGALYSVELPTDVSTLGDSLAGVAPRLVLELGAELVLAVQPVSRLSTRTALGAPFCAERDCLALATRGVAGASGRTVLFDPESRRLVPLAFPGPVRKLTMSTAPTRLYGLLDEAACGGAECGGLVTVELRATDASGAYPLAIDFSGQPMLPIRSQGALITGVSVAEGGQVRTTREAADGGGLEFQMQQFIQLGAFTTSNGEVTYFDGLAGAAIDFDARPAIITSATIRSPLVLADGGAVFTGPDGGQLGSLTQASVTPAGGGEGDPFRVFSISSADGPGTSPYVLDVSDGYFSAQAFLVVYAGQLPGLTSLPTSATDGTRLPVMTGFAARASPGDVVRFERGAAGGGFVECGRATVTQVLSDALEIDAEPADCAERVRFSVRAGGARPLVAVAELDGYLGRGGPGDVLTFTRRYQALPTGFQGPRTALTLTFGDIIPPAEGAFLTMQLAGRLEPYRLTVDAQSVLNCSSQLPTQFVLGSVAVAEVPTAVTGQASAVPVWSLWAAVPSANGVLELDHRLVRRGVLGTAESAFCHR